MQFKLGGPPTSTCTCPSLLRHVYNSVWFIPFIGIMADTWFSTSMWCVWPSHICLLHSFSFINIHYSIYEWWLCLCLGVSASMCIIFMITNCQSYLCRLRIYWLFVLLQTNKRIEGRSSSKWLLIYKIVQHLWSNEDIEYSLRKRICRGEDYHNSWF